MNIKKICVCGAGTMGSGIALTAAQSGFHTILYELNPAVLMNAKGWMEKNLGKLVEKGKMDKYEKENILRLVQFTGNSMDCIADLFIEAIIEKKESKIALFNKLAKINSSNVIFATNTSSLSVTEIAVAVDHPERMIGLHFFNPATIMKLVEIVTTKFNTASIIARIKELAGKLGKTPVICRDAPGFIVNRVARPFYIESLRLAEEGMEFASIDEVLEASGFKMGPFKLMDLIGNDVNYAVSCSVYDQLQHPERLKPSILQEKIVKAGKLGKKTGEGFYKY